MTGTSDSCQEEGNEPKNCLGMKFSSRFLSISGFGDIKDDKYEK